MPRKPVIEFTLPHEAEQFDGALVGGGTRKVGRDIYRVTLRAGAKPQCAINGEDYIDPPGQIDTKMWELLVAVRTRFNA